MREKVLKLWPEISWIKNVYFTLCVSQSSSYEFFCFFMIKSWYI